MNLPGEKENHPYIRTSELQNGKIDGSPNSEGGGAGMSDKNMTTILVSKSTLQKFKYFKLQLEERYDKLLDFQVSG